eukprot:652968-Pelagomonas_calceolata.AAC.4
MLAGADETLRFWRVFGEPPLAKDEKAGLLSGGGSLLAGAPLGGLRSIRECFCCLSALSFPFCQLRPGPDALIECHSLSGYVAEVVAFPRQGCRQLHHQKETFQKETFNVSPLWKFQRGSMPNV